MSDDWEGVPDVDDDLVAFAAGKVLVPRRDASQADLDRDATIKAKTGLAAMQLYLQIFQLRGISAEDIDMDQHLYYLSELGGEKHYTGIVGLPYRKFPSYLPAEVDLGRDGRDVTYDDATW